MFFQEGSGRGAIEIFVEVIDGGRGRAERQDKRRTRWREAPKKPGEKSHPAFYQACQESERASGMSGHGFQTIPFNKVGRKHAAES